MKKLGIALAGGGARGAYQIGAWRALEEHGIFNKVSAFSGASVGSLNAVLFAMGDYDKAYNTWMSLEKDSIFSLEKDVYKRLLKEKLDFFNKGIYNTARLESLVEETIDFSLIDKDVFIATTHLGDKDGTFFDLVRMNYKHYFKSDQQVVYQNINNLNQMDKVKTLLASCAIPVAFHPVRIGDETFYDGGVLDNAPFQPLIDAGCDVIIVIDLFTFSAMRLKKAPENIKMYTCYPKKSLHRILDFSHKYIEKRFLYGYNDMNTLLEKIKDELN